jgi:uncharacterized membrane protein YdfJ with MMPL/SSD domain
MTIQAVKSHADFLEKINGKETSYLLVYKSGSEKSDCALQNMQKVVLKLEDIDVFSVDVNDVKDIHQNYFNHLSSSSFGVSKWSLHKCCKRLP